MANTYTQIYIHYVFAVQNRMSLINAEWESKLYKYILAIVANNGHQAYAINGMPDHIHLLVSMHPTQTPSDLMHAVKCSSSLWINRKKLTAGKFTWQEGFGAFSYGKSQISRIASYIENQKEHHKKHSFVEEYIRFLKLFEIDYDEQYIYKPID